MADRINARNEPLAPFPKPDEGQHQCVLVDVVDLGYINKEFQGKKKGFKQYCALVWQIEQENPETRGRFEIAKEFQVTMFAKGSLRILLEQWRGKTFTDAEAEQGVPLDKLVGANGLMQVEHKQSESHPDRTYTNIISITQLPKAMPKIVVAGYVRDNERWNPKKGVTQDQAFPPKQQPEDEDQSAGFFGESFEDFPAALEDQGDELPF
jgi:hypothetical protein